MVCLSTVNGWNTNTGAELRVGSSSKTEINNRYEGGFTRAGVFSYLLAKVMLVDGGDRVEPDAEWTFTLQTCTFVDHAAVRGVGIFLLAFLYEAPRRININVLDSSVSDSVVIGTGGAYDSDYMLFDVAPEMRVQVARTRYTRSGNFNDAAEVRFSILFQCSLYVRVSLE